MYAIIMFSCFVFSIDTLSTHFIACLCWMLDISYMYTYVMAEKLQLCTIPHCITESKPFVVVWQPRNILDFLLFTYPCFYICTKHDLANSSVITF